MLATRLEAPGRLPGQSGSAADPPTTTIFSGYTVLCAAPDGDIDGGRHGLFHRDTRVLSRYRLTIDGRSPAVVTAARPESDVWHALAIVPRDGGRPAGPQLPQDVLELERRRRVGPGMIERLTLHNHSAIGWQGLVRLELDADFVDVAEAGRPQNRQIDLQRSVEEGVLGHDALAERDGRRSERGLRVTIESPEAPDLEPGGINFDLALSPGASWSATIRFAVGEAGAWRSPAPERMDPRHRQRDAWRRTRPSLEGHPDLERTFERAADDLFDLRDWELEAEFLRGPLDGSRWVLNAGVPTFTGVFGRDVLTSAWQAALLGPRAARGALEIIATTQAKTDDPWRDAQPGKLLHERRSGPLAELGLSPRDAYYGSQTTPAMFLLALSELWHWTGDASMLQRHRGTAERALGWLAGPADVDADGFVESLRRSPRGLRNQAWKDSDEAIRHADGSIVDGPVATVEEQAFAILAFDRLAEILIGLGDGGAAQGWLARSERLRRSWQAAFWWPEEHFYALALDGTKHPVRTIASNPGHALAAGIVPPELAAAVADRLMAPDLFSGWGVRTLSAEHPSYNPFAYHLGSVWPVEQATFALGFKRYGLDAHLDRLTDAVLAAAMACPDGRLPEALTGHPRDAFEAPVPYPAANTPQAWSASAVIQLIQIMLGLYPFAPLRMLAVVRPRLPAWLPRLTLRDVRVGAARVSLAFERRPDGSADWRVVARRGPLIVLPAPPPDSDDAGWFERLELTALRRAPGHLFQAARIALGVRSVSGGLAGEERLEPSIP